MVEGVLLQKGLGIYEPVLRSQHGHSQKVTRHSYSQHTVIPEASTHIGGLNIGPLGTLNHKEYTMNGTGSRRQPKPSGAKRA